MWLFVVLYGCASAPPPEDIVAGDYQFFTVAAEDGCLDGALEALFMPGGRDVPHPFEYLVYVPAYDATPASYEVDFRAPFLGMPVTVEATPEGLAIRGSVMDSVLLNEQQYGDCATTMTVDADLVPVAEGELGGEARIDVSDPRGSEGLCPTLDADPCQAVLSISAELDAPQ